MVKEKLKSYLQLKEMKIAPIPDLPNQDQVSSSPAIEVATDKENIQKELHTAFWEYFN